jgi:hypothetical protein
MHGVRWACVFPKPQHTQYSEMSSHFELMPIAKAQCEACHARRAIVVCSEQKTQEGPWAMNCKKSLWTPSPNPKPCFSVLTHCSPSPRRCCCHFPRELCLRHKSKRWLICFTPRVALNGPGQTHLGTSPQTRATPRGPLSTAMKQARISCAFCCDLLLTVCGCGCFPATCQLPAHFVLRFFSPTFSD